MKNPERLDKALFDARPYVEYWEKLEKLVKELWNVSSDEREFAELLNQEIEKAKEPFKTDLRIFLQKFEALKE